MKKGIFKSRFFSPYGENGKTNLRHLNGKSGVYLIKRKSTGKIVYIGYSGSNLYKTILRHFQSWDDPKQVRVTYKQKDAYSVRVIVAPPEKAARLEKALIIKHQPKDNPNKYNGYEPPAKDLAFELLVDELPATPIADFDEIIPF